MAYGHLSLPCYSDKLPILSVDYNNPFKNGGSYYRCFIWNVPILEGWLHSFAFGLWCIFYFGLTVHENVCNLSCMDPSMCWKKKYKNFFFLQCTSIHHMHMSHPHWKNMHRMSSKGKLLTKIIKKRLPLVSSFRNGCCLAIMLALWPQFWSERSMQMNLDISDLGKH